jgi:hypothetical protein
MTFNGGIKPIWMQQDYNDPFSNNNFGSLHQFNNLDIKIKEVVPVDILNINQTQTENTKETKKPKKKKEKIPSAVRKIVWNTYIGKDKPIGNCLCCNAEEISNTNFECGHIKSEKNGGEITIENLRPICGHCNKSIGGNNMDEFMDRYKIKKPINWNGINTI